MEDSVQALLLFVSDFEPMTPTFLSLVVLICRMSINIAPNIESSNEESLKNICKVLGTTPTQVY